MSNHPHPARPVSAQAAAPVRIAAGEPGRGRMPYSEAVGGHGGGLRSHRRGHRRATAVRRAALQHPGAARRGRLLGDTRTPTAATAITPSPAPPAPSQPGEHDDADDHEQRREREQPVQVDPEPVG